MGYPPILFVAGRAHTGSTLLELLLSSHSRVVSGGPLKNFSSEKDAAVKIEVFDGSPCSCGAAKRSCSFWTAVDREVRNRVGVCLWSGLDVYSSDPVQFVEHNGALLEALCAVSGRSFVADSSKSRHRLRRLLESGAFDVRPVALTRAPCAVVHSHVKRGGGWAHEAWWFTHNAMDTRKILSGHDPIHVRYETLVARPREVLTEIMRRVGLGFEEQQLDWASQEHHHIGGHHVRYEDDSQIQLRSDWRSGLSWWQKAGIVWLTLPTRLPGTWLYDSFPSVWRRNRFRGPAIRRRSEAS